MKNQTITTSLNFTSDVSDAISGLKKLREQMGNLTTDQSIFGNVDKEFEKVQKAMRDLAAKKEFTGTAKGAAEYKKILDSITVSANKIGQELTQIGTNANGAFKFKSVEQAQRVLAGLESNLKLVNKGLKDAQKELSTGLKNLGINDSIAKTVQGEENVIKLLKQEYEERKKTYELEKTRARETVANTFTKTWRQTPTTLISGIGNKDTKKTAAAAVDKAITDSLSEGVLKAQSWEKVQSNILERINATKIVVTDINMLLDSAKQKYELSEKAVQREEQEIVKVKQDMEAIGKINDEGVFEFSQGAQSAIDLANSVDKAKQSQTDLKGQVDAAKQSIQQEGQVGQQSLNQITAGTEQAVQQTKNFVNAEHQSTDAIREQNKEQERLDSTMSRMQMWITNILSIGNAWRKFTQIIRQTFSDVQKLDKAFASIAMVTDKTVEGLWGTYSDYADMANRLGQSTESAIKASALFYQQGLDTAEALKLTEDTMKLATLAGADFETATQQMTAALRGFHMEMDQGAHVTDVYSELAAHAAADVNGIAYAMSKTASIASSAGMSFETTAAFLTNMIETTQEAPENIGTAMKTIIARFTELKENVSAIDSEFDDLDYNKVDKALKSVGIQLKDANGQFRNLDEVFLELSQKWDSLDRNTQRYIATIAAGSRQQSRFIAMMEDYDRTMELVETAQDSAGRSSEQFAKYQDTVEYKLNQLKNSWEQFRTSLVDSDAFKKAIDWLTKFLNKLNKLSPKKLVALGVTFMTLGKQMVTNFIQGMRTSITGINKTITDAFNKELSKVNFSGPLTKSINNAMSGISKELLTQTKQEMFNIGIATEALTNENAKLLIKYTQEKNQLELNKQEINQLKSKTDVLTQDEEEKLLILEQQTNELREQIALKEKELYKNKISNAQARSFVASNTGQNVTPSGVVNPIAGQISSGVMSSMTSAISTAIIMGISGADIETTLKTAGITAITSAVPMLLNVAGEQVVQWFTTAALPWITATALPAIGGALAVAWPALLAAALVAGAIVIKKWADNAFDRVKELEKERDKLEKKNEAQESISKRQQEQTKELRDSVDSAEKLKKEFIELNQKVIKTTEEQERYNELVNQIRETMPEIVDSYDEQTGKLSIQENIWDSILAKQKKSLEISQKQSYIESVSLNNNKQQLLQTKKELNELNYQNKIINSEDRRNVLRSTFDPLKKMSSQEYANSILSDYNDWRSKRSFSNNWQDYYKTKNFSFNSQEKVFADKLELKIDDKTKRDAYDFLNILNKGTEATLEDFQEIYFGARADLAEEKYNLYELYMKELKTERDLIKEELDAEEKILKAQKELTIQTNLKEEGYNDDIASLAAGRIVGKNYEIAAYEKASQSLDVRYSYGDKIKYEYLAAAEDTKLALEQLNITNQAELNEWTKELKAQGKTQQEGLKEILAANILDQMTKEYIKNNYSDKQIKELPELLKQIESGSQNDIQKLFDGLKQKYGENSNFVKDLENKTSNIVENLNNQIMTLQNMTGWAEKAFSEWGRASLDAFQTYAQDVINKVGDETAKEYFNSLQNVLKGLSSTQINNVINAVNWENLDLLNYDEEKEKFLNMCEEMGIKGGEKLFENIIQVSTKYDITSLILDEEKFTEHMEEIKKKGDEIWGAESTFVSALAAAKEGTPLDYKVYEELNEQLEQMGLNASDYIQVMEDGSVIVTNAEKLKEVYEEQLNIEHKQIEADREKILNSIKLLELEKERALRKKKEEFDYAIDHHASGQDLGRISKEIFDLKNNRDEFTKQIKQYEDYLDELAEKDQKAQEKAKVRIAAFNNDLKKETKTTKEDLEKAIEDLAKKAEEAAEKAKDAWEKVNNAQEKVNDSLEKIKEKEQDVIDKTEELNKILYGDQYHKNKLDAMYNYSTALDAITTKTSRAKSSLESYNGKEDVSALMQTYMQGTHAEVVNRSAQNEVMAASIRNYEAVLSSKLAQEISSMNAAHGSHMSTNISDYVYKNGDVTAINFQALNAAQLPDEISVYVEECVETINNLQKQIDDNTEAIKQKEKEIRDMRKNALQRRVNLEKEVADILKKQAEDEIKTQKDKYDALKDADDDYLNALEEAINKERELRERNNEWNDLATKEKKLSLMQRDTSGANAKEVMSLEQDVQDTRENLLDKTIDDIVKGMKEMYELQQESREKELEYQEAMMESTEWIKQATAIVDGWTTSDKMVTWFIEHATDEYTEGSAAVQELMRMGWEDTGNQMVADSEMLSHDMSDLAIATHEEISQTVIETSEILTEQADCSLQSIVASAEDAIVKGEKALEDAIKEVQNARDDYREAIKELEEAETVARQAEENARKAQQDVEEQKQAAAAAAATAGVGGASNFGSSSSSSGQSIPDDQLVQKLYEVMGGAAANDMMSKNPNNPTLWRDNLKRYSNGKYYASGGLVDYTGPAWVDGSYNEPEAFLSAEDTKRIGAAAELLASLPFFSGGSINNSVNNGDSLIEVHINIENISSDVDLDNALDKMKNAIWEAANPAGSSVILSK